MNSRMDKYETESNVVPSRSSKNKGLYQSINKSEMTQYKSYNNATVIDEGAKEIDLNKIKNYVEALNNNQTSKNRRSLLDDKGLYQTHETREEATKDYDINSILEKAREQREKDYEQEKYKKLRDTQFDILSKLKVLDDKKLEEPIEDFNTEEKTLISLINTVASNKQKNELLAELQEENEELQEANEELQEELQKTRDQEKMKNMIVEDLSEELTSNQKIEEINHNKNDDRQIDDTFFTNSHNFSKEDFDDEDESTRSFGAKLGIFFLIVLIIAVIIGLLYFVFDINLLNYVKEYITKIMDKFIK